MEGLSQHLHNAALTGVVDPAMSKNGLHVSHILFADDILIFVKATEKNTLAIISILQDFAKLSGLHVNPGKSSFLGGKGSSICKVQHILNFKVEELPSNYLGLPLYSGKLTKAMCSR